MRDLYQEKMTITLDGDERDVWVHAWINVEPGLGVGGGWGAELDGEAQVLLPEGWFDLSDLNLDASDPKHIADTLCDQALEDDSAECVEAAE